MDFELLFPGRFLRASDFKGKAVTLTVSDVELEPLPQEKGEDRERGIVSFRETKKGLVLNRTNASAFVAMFGRDTTGWANHKITFHPETVQLGREKVLGIRVTGSPELDADLTFDLKLPRKKPRRVTLQPTGTTKPPAAVDPVTGEVDDDIGFGADAPHPSENDTEAPSSASGAESDAGAADGHIPGRGAKSAQGELA